MKNFSLLVLLLAVAVPESSSDFGGHDLFTSLAQLEVLWHNEVEVVQKMRDSLGLEDKMDEALRGYLEQHDRLGLGSGPRRDFLGHPVNAYFFVRHVGHGWSKVREAAKEVDLNATDKLGGPYPTVVYR